MKSLTVGKRIVLGFALLIVIAVTLGMISIIQLSKLGKGATRMSEAYVPEVAVSNNIERNLMMAMYANRGYQFTEDEAFLREGQSQLSAAIDFIGEADALGQRENLAGMLSATPEIRKEVESYRGYVKETASTIQTVQSVRTRMDSSAAAFVENLGDLLHLIETDMARVMEERTFKVKKTEEVLAHGNNARILNMRAQATGDNMLFENATKELDLVVVGIDALRSVTRDASDLAMLDAGSAAIKRYKSAVAAFAEESRLGESARAGGLAQLQKEMDASASVFIGELQTMSEVQLAKMEEDINLNVEAIAWVNDIIDLGNNARVNNFKGQALRDTLFVAEAIEQIESMAPIYGKLLDAKKANTDAASMISVARNSSDTYKQAMVEYMDNSRTLAELGVKRNESGTDALEASKRLAALGIGETTHIANEAVANAKLATKIMITGEVIAVIAGVLLALLITRSITGPLLKAIADLTSGSAESTSAAEQVSSASQSLAEGASEQASSLEETSSSMEEITSMVAHSADVAKQTSSHARDASEAAENGVRSMSELRSGANSVNSSAKEMEEAMEAIKQSSDSIRKIIKTIDEIAFQTNILALNAAVEAARAGEAGAGFAVVADEVRSLARRAAEAAQETATLIEGSMERSERGVRVNETVGKNLKDVMDKAEAVESVLKTISDKVNEVTNSMQGLEASAVEQQEGISQINTAMTQVNDVTQANAASAEEAASAAEQMNAQALTLLETVGVLSLMVTGKQSDSTARLKSASGIESRSSKSGFSLPGD